MMIGYNLFTYIFMYGIALHCIALYCIVLYCYVSLLYDWFYIHQAPIVSLFGSIEFYE
jgi:hypothetical protein